MQLLIAVLLLLASLPALTAPASVRELEEYLAAIPVGKLEFIQSATNPGGSIINSSGILSYARPNKFRVSYEFPDRLEIVSNGEDLWIHDFALNQVVVSKLADVPGARGFLAVLTVDKVSKNFAKRSQPGVRGVLNWLILVPSNPDEYQFSECSIAFDENGAIKNVQITDLHDNKITVGFTDPNAVLPVPSEFEYVIPSGAEIIQEHN